MPTDTAAPIRLLHLSDIHFRTDRAWDADPVLKALARFIAGEVRAGLAPDLVAITGDLAYSGKAEEYRLARDWLERQLWPALTADGAPLLARDRMLLVPGNHDVDRDAVNFMVKTAQDALLKDCDQDQIAAVLGDREQCGPFLRRHAAYLDFCANWYGLAPDAPWWQRTLTLGTQRLHCAGLDSAWMSAGDREQGALLLGRRQVYQTVLAGGAEDADWSLALLHHPWSFLDHRDAGEARETIYLYRDLVLRGHRHQTDSAQFVSADPRRTCVELAAGCVYDGSPYPNAFQWVELWPATAEDPRRVRVLFRAWVKGAWQVDRNQPECPDGEASFATPAPPGTTPRSRPRGAEDPGRYLDALFNETAFIEVRGLSTGGPQAHRYPIGDLYIELQSAGGTGSGSARSADPGRGADHPLRAALASPRLVISGDPGCGKTTFLRWVAHCLATARLGREPDAAARHLGLAATPLPVLVLVRIGDWLDYMERVRGTPEAPKVPDSPDWLPAFQGAYAAEHRLGLDAAAFRRLFDDGVAMILLDGLDEAPDRRQRATAARIIEHAALAWPRCPLVVTSRPAALAEQTILPGFGHTAIERLDETAIAGFLDRWSRALFRGEPARAEAHRRELAAALASRPEIRLLTRNAVMLTALAVVHWNDKRLPEQRAELYESIIRWLLLAREYRHGRAPLERSRQLLADLALTMQTDPRGRATQVSRRAAAERIAHRFSAGGRTAPEPVDQAEAYLAAEELDSGIVVRRGHDLRYWHLTFQEYLAACALAGKPDAERAALLLDPPADPPLYRPEWRETVLLLGGVLYLQGQDRTDALVGTVLDRLGQAPTRAAQASAAGLIGALVRDLTRFRYRPADPRYAQVLEAALAVFDPVQAAAIPLADRIAAAEALTQAGDPRLGWDNPRRWVKLPRGAFAMGAQMTDPTAPGYDPDAYDNEAPVREVTVSPFRIGRYPVTVAEFAAFMEDEDCRDTRWWLAGGADEAIEPDEWEDQQAHPSRPVVYVSWYQAMAYCAWLTDRLTRHQGIRDCPAMPQDWVARLPTEAEWEYAARGSAGRRYPWGAEPPDPGRVNFDATKLNAPSPVGVFPGGASREGVEDLAGNVWEWCLDGYSEDFYTQCQAQGQAADPCPMAAGGSPRVVRGGSFRYRARYLRASFRGGDGPEVRDMNWGFRCVLAAPRQPLPLTLFPFLQERTAQRSVRV